LNHQGMSKIEQFERVVVFKSARFLPLLLSVVATLMLAAAAVALLYSIFPSWKPKKPGPVPEPPQVSVNSAEITSYLSRSTSASSSATQANPPSQPGNGAPSLNAPAVPNVSPDAKSLAGEIDAIRKQALALKLPWANEYQTVCQQVYFGNCYGQRTVVASRGVSGYIDQALNHHNDASVPVETVQLGGESYRINPSHYDSKLAILKELEAVLASVQSDDAHKVIAAWAKIREERERVREKTLSKEEERRAEEYSKAEIKYQTTVEKKHVIRGASLYTAGLALGGFVLLGLILAVLAVERHTRLLEAQMHTEPSSISAPALLQCKNCGHSLDASSTFCDECGTKVG
jgi:hypothetical protein